MGKECWGGGGNLTIVDSFRAMTTKQPREQVTERRWQKGC